MRVGVTGTRRSGMRHDQPVTTVRRQVWLDVARGLAVLSMVVAHTAPVGGIFNVSEYLTMPWFALLMGCGFWFAHESKPAGPVFFGVLETVRGLVLIALGIATQPIYDQVAVVLQTLGFASIIVGWLVPWAARRPWQAAALAVALWLASPAVIVWTLQRWRGTLDLGDQVLAILGAGPYYRAATMAVWMLVGVAVARHLRTPDGAGSRRLLTEATLLTVATGALHLVGKKFFHADFMPYSGTLLETGHNAILAMAATWWCAWLFRARPTLEGAFRPLAALGRVALSAYVFQLVILRILTSVFLGGERDDHWWVLITCCVLLLGFAVLWERLAWPRPVEQLIRIPDRLLRSWRAARR